MLYPHQINELGKKAGGSRGTMASAWQLSKARIQYKSKTMAREA